MINDSSTISIENIYDDEISQIKESGPLAATLTATGFMNKVCKALADSGKSPALNVSQPWRPLVR